MAYSRLYTAIGFEDRPSRKSPMSAANLNKIEQGIVGLDDRIVEMSVREDDLEERLEDVETRDICSRTVKSANAATHSNYPTDNAKVPDMSFMSYWNGAYSSNGGSNLTYCKHGAFGTMATKNVADYTPVANLVTTVAGKPLDAIMGKELNDKISAVESKTSSNSDSILNRQTLGYTKKNLLKNTAVTTTKNGITFTVNEDKSITLNGTATAAIWDFRVGSFTPTIGETYEYTTNAPTYNNDYVCYLDNIDGSVAWHNNEHTFTPTKSNTIYCKIYVASGVTLTNYTFYPMIRLAGIEDDIYEPYADDVKTRLDALTPIIFSDTEPTTVESGKIVMVYE